MSRWRVGGALALLGGFGVLLWWSLASGAPPADLTSSRSCRDCHSAVYDEWERSMHAHAFTDPLVLAENQSNNFRKLDCIPCHAPAPVFEHGIGKQQRVVERVSFREEGVDCLACHRLHEHVVGPKDLVDSRAACRPVASAELASTALCAPCHNQHNTVDEWEASTFPQAGIGCLDCHMAPVNRTRKDGSTYTGRSHVFIGGHDPETLQRAYELTTATKDAPDGSKVLVVSVTNHGAGHNFPADARHRALDLIVTLIQPDGVEIPAREARPWGRERGTARRRFRNPYREELERIENRDRYGRENTQIVAGETLTLEVPYDPAAVSDARVELIYKLTPIVLDADGTVLHDARVHL